MRSTGGKPAAEMQRLREYNSAGGDAAQRLVHLGSSFCRFSGTMFMCSEMDACSSVHVQRLPRPARNQFSNSACSSIFLSFSFRFCADRCRCMGRSLIKDGTSPPAAAMTFATGFTYCGETADGVGCSWGCSWGHLTGAIQEGADRDRWHSHAFKVETFCLPACSPL